jgi:DNA-binding PadR family transcriptional regulator
MNRKLLPTTIIELLEKNKALKVDDLLKRATKRHTGLSEQELEKYLMKMEIQGLIRVYRMPRGKKRVELT